MLSFQTLESRLIKARSFAPSGGPWYHLPQMETEYLTKGEVVEYTRLSIATVDRRSC